MNVVCNCCSQRKDWPILVLYTDGGFTICEECVQAAVDRLNDIRANELSKKHP